MELNTTVTSAMAISAMAAMAAITDFSEAVCELKEEWDRWESNPLMSDPSPKRLGLRGITTNVRPRPGLKPSGYG